MICRFSTELLQEIFIVMIVTCTNIIGIYDDGLTIATCNSDNINGNVIYNRLYARWVTR